MSVTKGIAAVILAGGKGTRMKATDKNKVVYDIGGKPIITYPVNLLKSMQIRDIIVVVGFAKDSVEAVLNNQVTYAVQAAPLGTADAFKAGLTKVPAQCHSVLSLYGDDSAFYTKAVLTSLIHSHQQHRAAITLLTVKKADPTGLGRIIRNSSGNVVAIVEEKNANPEQKQIQEINTGLYCFDHAFIKEAIKKVEKNPVSGEFYLTDVVAIAIAAGHPVHALRWEDDSIWHGVNTQEQHQAADQKMVKSPTTLG